MGRHDGDERFSGTLRELLLKDVRERVDDDSDEDSQGCEHQGVGANRAAASALGRMVSPDEPYSEEQYRNAGDPQISTRELHPLDQFLEARVASNLVV